MTTMTRRPAVEAFDLAADLLADLAQHIGDPDGIAAVLTDWRADLEPDDLALTAVAALWRTFTEALHYVPADQVPPGAIAFNERNPTDD